MTILKKLVPVFFSWLPFAVVITAMSMLIFSAVQHNYRASFNDPQIQIAEDVAMGLSEGKSINQFNQRIDIGRSLSTYINVYDDSGTPIAYSGMLGTDIPRPPQGVFDYARENDETRITWQPQPDVRSAIVVKRFSNDSRSGYILVGRNLRELEKRTDYLRIITVWAWAATMAGSFIVLSIPVILALVKSRRNKAE